MLYIIYGATSILDGLVIEKVYWIYFFHLSPGEEADWNHPQSIESLHWFNYLHFIWCFVDFLMDFRVDFLMDLYDVLLIFLYIQNVLILSCTKDTDAGARLWWLSGSGQCRMKGFGCSLKKNLPKLVLVKTLYFVLKNYQWLSSQTRMTCYICICVFYIFFINWDFLRNWFFLWVDHLLTRITCCPVCFRLLSQARSPLGTTAESIYLRF